MLRTFCAATGVATAGAGSSWPPFCGEVSLFQVFLIQAKRPPSSGGSAAIG